MATIGKTAGFLVGTAAIGVGAYAWQQHTSGKLHDEQQRIDRAIAENKGNPATVELLRDRRPSDFTVNWDKSFVLGGIGGLAGASGALLFLAGGMQPIPSLLPGTGVAGAIGIGLLAGAAAGVIHNTLGNRFD